MMLQATFNQSEQVNKKSLYSLLFNILKAAEQNNSWT